MVKNQKLLKLMQMALLCSICILMAFTPLGFLKVGLIEITFYTIPVAISAVLLGPVYAVILGGLFGLLSFIQCFSNPILGVPLLAISPFLTFVICFVPRILIGFLSAYIYKILQKFSVNKNISSIIACFACPILNTILFISALILAFGNSELIQGFMAGMGVENFVAFAAAFAGINAVVEIPSCAIISFAVLKVLQKINR